MFAKLFINSVLAVTLGATVATYAAEEEVDEATAQLLESGRSTFISNCGFCHGRDAQGGSQGLDLVRSQLVTDDSEGNLIGEVVRSGRADKGMPAFNIFSNDDIQAMVAYIQQQKQLAESADGNRRSVEEEDLLVGDAEAGKQYFQTHCSSCHSATGDLADVGSRFKGLGLLMRFLYPGSESRSAVPPVATLTVITKDVISKEKQRVEGTLAYRDEFTVALTDKNGRYRSWSTDDVDVVVNDPLEAHLQQLGRYTDKDMHDVFAYLHTLK